MKNENKAILILICLILTVSFYQLFFKMFNTSKCNLSPFFGNEQKYNWLMNPDSIENFSCFYSIGNKNTNEFVYAYSYANKYRYILKEVKLFNNLLPNQTIICNNFFTDKAEFDVFYSFSLSMGPEVKMESKACLIRIHNMKINFGSFKEIEKKETTNAVIYKGKFSQYGITDENDEYQMFTTFKDAHSPESALILFKKADSFYIILVNSVNSKYPIDNAIALLNLN